MRIAIITSLTEADQHLLGFQAIVTGPASPWLGSRFGTRATVYREGLRLLDGVALVIGSNPEEMAALVEGCPQPVILVAYSGSLKAPRKGKGFRGLEAAIALRRGLGQSVYLFKLIPGFWATLEVEGSRVALTGLSGPEGV